MPHNQIIPANTLDDFCRLTVVAIGHDLLNTCRRRIQPAIGTKGLAVGAVGGYGLIRLMRSQYFASQSWQRQMAEQLYDVKGTDPPTFVVIATLLVLIALLACWLPARKAAQVEPLEALRHE